jgi:hypothetical protein
MSKRKSRGGYKSTFKSDQRKKCNKIDRQTVRRFVKDGEVDKLTALGKSQKFNGADSVDWDD